MSASPSGSLHGEHEEDDASSAFSLVTDSTSDNLSDQDDAPLAGTSGLHQIPPPENDDAMLSPSEDDDESMSDTENDDFLESTRFEKLKGSDNFTSWRSNILTTLAHRHLDDLVISDNCSADVLKVRLMKKKAQKFIRLHLDCVNFNFFVKDLSEYEPKKLLDSICAYYGDKSPQNAARIMERLHEIHFDEEHMQESINKFRDNFKLLGEVASGYLDIKALDSAWFLILLNRLPDCFHDFRARHFSNVKGKGVAFSIDYLLSSLEIHIRRQDELPHRKQTQCHICYKIVTVKNMKRHIESIHQNKKHPCPMCGARLSHSSDVKRHIKSIHKEAYARMEAGLSIDDLIPAVVEPCASKRGGRGRKLTY